MQKSSIHRLRCGDSNSAPETIEFMSNKLSNKNSFTVVYLESFLYERFQCLVLVKINQLPTSLSHN
ncbi:protein of unknown function [Moritella yayanosii]|uniref:Uncharacterized protein n=1 Tax=Moritella yayanosii TaxID=69539 RepID=A0A330LNF4_9GAMM|nr:protein of unknown function [Moritella yayanosii]